MTPTCPGRLVHTRRIGLCMTCADLDVLQDASPDAPAFIQPSGVWSCESWSSHAVSLGLIAPAAPATDRGVSGGNRGGVGINRMDA